MTENKIWILYEHVTENKKIVNGDVTDNKIWIVYGYVTEKNIEFKDFGASTHTIFCIHISFKNLPVIFSFSISTPLST